MTFALLGLLLAAEPPAAEPPAVVDEPELELPPPVWEIYGGVSGDLRPDALGGGGGFMLGVNRKFLGFLRPELSVATTLVTAPIDYVIAIRIGARLELPNSTPWKPYLWTAFAHNHESAIMDVKNDPAGHLLGLSSAGVHHRSGLEVGLGLTYELPRLTPWKVATRLGTRVTFTQFVGDPYPPRYLQLVQTAGICF